MQQYRVYHWGEDVNKWGTQHVASYSGVLIILGPLGPPLEGKCEFPKEFTYPPEIETEIMLTHGFPLGVLLKLAQP